MTIHPDMMQWAERMREYQQAQQPSQAPKPN